MLRAARLDADLYDKVIADTAANRQALAAVAITSLLSGFGVGFAAVIAEGGLGFFGGVLVGFVASLGGWLIWYLYTYWFGTTMLKNPEAQASFKGLFNPELMRAMGFANSARALSFFYFIPYIGWLIALAVSAWALYAGINAVGQSLNLNRFRAAAACVIGWIPYMLIVFLTAALTV